MTKNGYGSMVVLSLEEYTRLTLLFKNICIPFINELPILDLNIALSKLYIQPLKVEAIALFVVSTFIAQIFIQYTLYHKKIKTTFI